ncbi:hypothetical protein BD626DRAFT_473874 [Schizophyllum amplum]|uniref:C2H2-type domain-containing protein n=1 Tax=Schizophyllum amplum TaxID=97359 RepID=A0A550CX53_9AGAR|nr:hypothetical protein BD626DRAFT_473874 [Auriculariopsis ampla]
MASNAKDTDFRRKWDTEEYAEKARKRDAEEAERAKENEERLKQGKRPRKGGAAKDLPKPTQLAQRRENDLELDKNLGKTMVVHNLSNRGPGQPGFYCETCQRNYKDSTGYLDHINSRAHLRALGQTTTIERSSLEQVRRRIAFLREQTRNASTQKAYDFDQRLADIKAKQVAAREEKKAAKKQAKEAARLQLIEASGGGDDDMAKMMGFDGFGTTKK